MSWIALKNYYNHEMPCPNCQGLDTERFTLTDEAGSVTYVMDRHLECGWEKIYEPELLGLVEGRKMSIFTKWDLSEKTKKARRYFGGMNVYELFGRAIIYLVGLYGGVTFAITLSEGIFSYGFDRT